MGRSTRKVRLRGSLPLLPGGRGDYDYSGEATVRSRWLIQRFLPRINFIFNLSPLPALVRLYHSREEAEQQAMIGLVKAARLYDWSRGLKFLSLLIPHIRGALAGGLRHGCGTSLVQVKDKDWVGPRPQTYTNYQTRSPDGELVPFGNYVEDCRHAAPDDYEIPGLPREVTKALKQLTKRQQRVLWLRHADGRTLEEIGLLLGLSKERIRQVEKKAREKVRALLGLPPGTCSRVYRHKAKKKKGKK